MNFKRFFAVIKARNIEFFRDRATLGWNLVFPILLLVGFSFIFSDSGRAVYMVGVTQEPIDSSFVSTKYIKFIPYQDAELAKIKVSQHEIDLYVDFEKASYWVNDTSPKGYFVEKLLLAEHQSFKRHLSSGQKIRYVDWVLPGILGMNMMFSCLFGVGYVIVRYRKNAVLKRLNATPLTAFEFVSAQLISRLFIVIAMSAIVYTGCNFFFDFYMLGSYLDLLIIGILGALSLIALGLLLASRSKSEELTGGLLNLSSWPMMLLSGVWFSLEGAPAGIRSLAEFLPLTHLVSGARKIITEGATLADISYHVYVLLTMTAVCLALGAYLFNWNAER
jgi:ABC-2 type transport system permease protein